jgi:Major Facilitator Superfamily
MRCSSVGWLVADRFIDRVGNGMRGAPRDALVADVAPGHLRGASFGLRQSLDTIGAFLGPSLAIGLMWLTANDFQAVFWIAVIPACLSLALILFAVHEPARPKGLRQVRSPLSCAELKRLGPSYWWVVSIATFSPVRSGTVPAREPPFWRGPSLRRSHRSGWRLFVGACTVSARLTSLDSCNVHWWWSRCWDEVDWCGCFRDLFLSATSPTGPLPTSKACAACSEAAPSSRRARRLHRQPKHHRHMQVVTSRSGNPG